MSRLALFCWSLLLIGGLDAVDRSAPPAPPQPSMNHGRLGIYQVSTTIAGYNYYVCVPKAYDESHPAGLHLFFHGQNNQGAAKDWDRWQKYFLEPFTLIGINMEYTDGDIGRDTEGKVKAAQQAIAQVCADYKIVAPRGVVSSFSAGGEAHSLMADMFGSTRSLQWPFCHSSLYSANYDRDVSTCVPMSWCVAIGTDEWSSYSLGVTAVKRGAELYQAMAKGGTPDLRFLVTHKGHTITDADANASAKSFSLSDLTFAAFLYAPDYPEKELRPIVDQANHQQLSTAAAALAKVLAKPTLTEALQTKAVTLQGLLDERQNRVIATLQTLPQDDPVLALWYGPQLLAQLKGHPQEKALKAALMSETKTKESQATLAAHAELARQFSTLFGPGGSNPGVVADKRPFLMSLAPHLPPTSRAGLMVLELQALSP